MRLSALCLLAVVACAQTPATTEVKAGGIALTLPAPAGDFAEVGDRLRTTFFELLAPSTNRVLTAYAPAGVVPSPAKPFDVYAMVQVSRQTEYVDCPPEGFAELKKGVDEAMANGAADKLEAFGEELNLRLKSLGAKPLTIGKPEMLGRVYDKKDSAGYLMLVAAKAGESSTTMATGIALLRVKQRALFAYFYRKYDSPDSVQAVRKSLEAWSDDILARNK